MISASLEKAAQAFKDGRYVEAVHLSGQARDSAKAESCTPAEQAEMQFELGRALNRTAKFEEAEACLQDAKDLTRQAHGDRSMQYSAVLDELGLLKYFQHKTQESAELFNEALSIRRGLFSEPSLEVSEVLTHMAWMWGRLGDVTQGMSCIDEALSIRRQIVGEAHEDYGESLGAKAYLTGLEGNWAESERLQRQALAMLENRLHAEHANIAVSINNLVCALMAMEKNDEVEQLCQRAIAIRSKACGEDSIATAMVLSNLGSHYLHRGEVQKAVAQFEKALSIAEKALGPDSPGLSHYLLSLAHIYRFLKRPEAEEMDKRLQSVINKNAAAGSTDIDSIMKLAYTLQMQKQYDKADAEAVRARHLAEKMFGAKSMKVAEIFEYQGLWNMQPNPERARECFTEVMRIRKKLLGKTHKDLAKTLQHLSTCIASQGDRETANVLLAQAQAIHFKHGGEEAPKERMLNLLEKARKAMGDKDPNIIQHIRLAADALRAGGKVEESDALYEDYWRAREEQWGAESEMLANDLIVTGLLRAHAGEHQAAVALLKRGIAIKEKTIGEDNEDLVQPLEGLAAAAREARDLSLAETSMRRAVGILEKVHGKDSWLLTNCLGRLILVLQQQERGEEVKAIATRMKQIPKPTSLETSQHTEKAVKAQNKLIGSLAPQTRLAFVMSHALWSIKELKELMNMRKNLNLLDKDEAESELPE